MGQLTDSTRLRLLIRSLVAQMSARLPPHRSLYTSTNIAQPRWNR
jgi:hypothetical protein